MEKRVLLKDIAAKVGVSIALVSYVLNNKEGRVNSKMAVKIRKAAASMNYLPNLVAKGLQSGKTQTIGLIVADISNSFFSRIARIIEREAELAGYTVIFGSTDENADKSKLLIEAFLNRQVDGLILTPAASTADQLRLLKRRKVPFVLVDRYFPEVKANSVQVNNYSAAYNGTEHLIQAGHKNVALVTYKNSGLSHFDDRTDGYKAAQKKFNRAPNIITAGYQQMEKEMPGIIQQLAGKPGKADAVFFASHSLAIQGLKQINRMGIDVPEELAILSFDENDAFDLFDPPVSFIRQPLSEIGSEAVRLLIDNINHPSKTPTVVEVETELVIRLSSIRARQKKAG